MINLLCLLLALLLSACGPDNEQQPRKAAPPAAPAGPAGCRDCHGVKLDRGHDFSCSTCHRGTSPAAGREKAHENLLTHPAHPDFMAQTCGKCHAKEVESCRGALHFTLKNAVNLVRTAFGGVEVASLTAIPEGVPVDSPQALADDLLRRRCLRCHLYYSGDPYPATQHGLGCAACHLPPAADKNHEFTRPASDEPCLRCHYANFVGSDYHGRYEHDFHWDYRTPYRADGPSPRPYGVEFHQLAPDIHQQRGLICIDCHSGAQLMGPPGNKTTCKSCHQPEKTFTGNLSRQNDKIFLSRKKDEEKIEVPQLQNPAHKRYDGDVHCTVCHAQWSFNDRGTHLLRQDVEDYDPWGALTVQSCYEVEDQLETNLYTDKEYPVPFMRDKINGTARLGIWLKGFELRRWESPLLCRDGKTLRVCRPLLDLHLTYVNGEEEVVFDAITPGAGPNNGLRPYVPHTIGRAGAFYHLRLGNQKK